MIDIYLIIFFCQSKNSIIIKIMNQGTQITLDSITLLLSLCSLPLLGRIIHRLRRAKNQYIPGITLVNGICWSDATWDLMLIISTVYLVWGDKADIFFKLSTLIMIIALSQS
jgi:predicted transcriptional regulator